MLLLLLRLTRECFCCFLYSSGLLQMVESSTLLWAARSREAFVKAKNVLALQIRKISRWIWCWIGSTIGVDLFCWILSLFFFLLFVCCLKRKAAEWVVVFNSSLWVGTCFVFRHYCYLLFVFFGLLKVRVFGFVFVFSFFSPWRESKTEDFIFDSVCNARVMWWRRWEDGHVPICFFRRKCIVL
jgi:hypothetical protein